MQQQLAEPCRIIGVLDDGASGLTKQAINHIEHADLIVGGKRTLDLFAELFASQAECRDLSGQIQQVPEWVRDALAKSKKVVVLATGDPLCHGIAGFLQSRLCIEACEVIPNLSMVQLACARLGMPWQGIKVSSVHGKNLDEWQIEKGTEQGMYPLLHDIKQHEQLAIYTSPQNTPGRIARMLLATGLADQYHIAIAENLMLENESVLTQYSVSEVAKSSFADPNIVILWRNEPFKPVQRFGLSDSEYFQRKPEKGLITKCEVRAVTLARMQLRTDSVIWDIGAGSGSVGLEAARLCPDGRVFAIEKNAEDFSIAEQNRRQFAVHNYQLIHGKAPDGLIKWPEPDAVFIGGSGGNLSTLITLCLSRLKLHGVLVMNFVTIENVSVAIDVLNKINAKWDMTQLQVSRSRPILAMHRMMAENPVWIISATNSQENDE